MVDLRFLQEYDLTARAISVYEHLLLRSNQDGQCWPAVPTIARELQLSEKTIRRAINDLKAKGLLTTEQRYRRSGAKSSLMFQIVRP